MKKFRKALSGCLAAAMLMGLFTVGAAAQEPITFSRVNQYTPGQFIDVPENQWYASRVKDCYEMGLMSGNSANTFNPAGMFTLAEASVVAARLHISYYNTDGIKSASGPWYQGMVNYCIEHGIYNEGDFEDYNANATRAQMAGIMVNAVPEWALPAKGDITKLPDVAYGTPYYEEIFTLYNAGALSGSDEYGTFQPYAYITRAEVATIINAVAQPEIRKPATLTPLTQRKAPELPSENFGTMSQGLMGFKDPNTGLWGYMKGTGAVIVRAAYSKAETFDNGYAVVQKDGKYGLLDWNGKEVILCQYDSVGKVCDGVYYRYTDKDRMYDLVFAKTGKILEDISFSQTPTSLGGGFFEVRAANEAGDYLNGVIDSSGKWIVTPRAYIGDISYTGTYLWVEDQDDMNLLYRTDGTLIANSTSIKYAKNSMLYAVQDGNKYSLYGPKGQITEAIYDDIVVYEDSDFALLKYGDMTGLAGSNGVIFEVGEYNIYTQQEGYAIVYVDGNWFLADVNGIIEKLPARVSDHNYHLSVVDGYVYIYTKRRGTMYQVGVLDRAEGKLYTDTAEYEICNGYARCGNTYILDDGTRYASEAVESAGENYFAFKTSDGKYGFAMGGKVVVEARYATSEEAIAAYKTYKISTENGKPVVLCGNNAANNFEPVIQYYKGKICYDEIKELGEGYYACLFNTTWYLIHV